jgi:hypothetical protein
VFIKEVGGDAARFKGAREGEPAMIPFEKEE